MKQLSKYMQEHKRPLVLLVFYRNDVGNYKGPYMSFDFDVNYEYLFFTLKGVRGNNLDVTTQEVYLAIADTKIKFRSVSANNATEFEEKALKARVKAVMDFFKKPENALCIHLNIPNAYKKHHVLGFKVGFKDKTDFLSFCSDSKLLSDDSGIYEWRLFFEQSNIEYIEENFE